MGHYTAAIAKLEEIRALHTDLDSQGFLWLTRIYFATRDLRIAAAKKGGR